MQWKSGMAIVFAAAVQFSVVDRVVACSCGTPPPPKVALSKSDAVFTGKVVAIEGSATRAYYAKVTLAVDRAWKGAVNRQTTIVTPVSDGMCRYPFKVGESYLVYAGLAGVTEDPSLLATNLCTRTRPAAHASGDLKALGAGTPLDQHFESRLTTSSGIYYAGSPIPLRLAYVGRLKGWSGHIRYDARTTTIELGGHTFLRVSRTDGKRLTGRTKNVSARASANEPFAVVVDLKSAFGITEPGTYSIAWGCQVAGGAYRLETAEIVVIAAPKEG